MFRIECFVENRNLAGVLMYLAGVAKNVQSRPVADVGAPPRTVVTGGTLDLLRKHLAKSHAETVTRASMMDFLKRAGRNPSSANHFITAARKAGIIGGMNGTRFNASYPVINPTAKRKGAK